MIFSNDKAVSGIEPKFPWPKKYVSSPNSLLVIDGGKRRYTRMKSSIAITGSLAWHYECAGFLLDILSQNYRVHVYHNDVEGFIDLFAKTYKFKSLRLPNKSLDGAFYDRIIILSSEDPVSLENAKLITRLMHHKDSVTHLPSNEAIKLTPLVGGKAKYVLPIYRTSSRSVSKRLHRIVVVGELPRNTRKILRHVAEHTTIEITHFSRINVFIHKRINNIVGAQADKLEEVMIQSRFAFVNNHKDRFSGVMAIALSCKTPMLMDSFQYSSYNIPALTYKATKELVSKLNNMSDAEFENLHTDVINFSERALKNNSVVCPPFVKGSFSFVEIQNIAGQPKWKGNIPQLIFQAHERRFVPENMAKGIKSVMTSAPDASYTFYDAEERKKFIKTHYPSAFDPYESLLAEACKCELFRYIRLYVEGGVYLDSPYTVIRKRKMFGDIINRNDEFLASWDMPIVRTKRNAVSNGFIASVPKHPILHEVIKTALENIRNQAYLDNPLAITGPILLGRVIEKMDGLKMEGVRIIKHDNGKISDNRGTAIQTIYPEYDEDMMILENGIPRYGELWEMKKVYKLDKTNRSSSASLQLRKR